MNVYAVVILAALFVEFGASFVANVLNLRSLRRDLPPEFRDVYDAEAYSRTQAYTRARTRFNLLVSAFDLALLLAFWFLGGFAWFDDELRRLELGDVATGVLFIGALGLFKGIASLPFEIYSTFVLEERFGFNRTTPKTFLLDLAKGALLGVVIGVPVLAAILYFFEATGPAAWIWAWLLVTLLGLLLQHVLPTWILPLFNKFEPLPDGELRDAISDYAEREGFALSGVYMIDGSRRSSRANAFFTGFGKNKRIALYDTLVEKHSVRELVAILAHEVGHYERGHIVKNMLLGILHSGVMFYLLSIFLEHEGLFDAFGLDEPSIYAGLVFFGLLYSPVELLLQLGLQKLSRVYEYEADRFAAETVAAEPMVSALKKLSADNLTHLTPHPLYVTLFHSHPPVLERVRALRTAMA